MPWPEAAKRVNQESSGVISGVMTLWVQVWPSSIEVETSAWMTLRACGSLPG